MDYKVIIVSEPHIFSDSRPIGKPRESDYGHTLGEQLRKSHDMSMWIGNTGRRGISNYPKAEESTTEKLQRIVKEHIEDGWKLQGGVSIAFAPNGNHYFAQAMIKV